MPWTRKSPGTCGALLILAASLLSSGADHRVPAGRPSQDPGANLAPNTAPKLQDKTSPLPGNAIRPSSPGGTAAENQIHPNQFTVVIDAGHGGDDRGVALGTDLWEKDLTLATARRLRMELQEHGIAARLLRENDVSLGLDERVELSNAQHANVFVSLHACLAGRGVRIYSPMLIEVPAVADKRFLPWESAQSAHANRSQNLAQMTTGQLTRKKIPVVSLSAPLRPLNSINAPAIAVELAVSANDAPEFNGQKFQTTVAAGVAAAIAQFRAQMDKLP